MSIFLLELDKPIEWPVLVICKKPVDKNKTKKNTLTAHYIKDWHLPSETLQVVPTEGCQDNVKIRSEWKEALNKFKILKKTDEEKIHLSMTTDAAAPMKLARQKTTDPELKFENESDCFDHQVHLLIDESSLEVVKLNEALKKGHTIIKHFSK